MSFWTSPGYLDNRFILIVSSCFEPDVEAPISANHFTQFSLFNSALFSIFLEFLYGQQLESGYVYFLSFYIGVSPSKDEFLMKSFLKLWHFTKDRHIYNFPAKILSLQTAKLVPRLPGMKVPNGLLVVGVLTCLCDCLCLSFCLCLCASENQPLIICFTFDYVAYSKITSNHRLRKFSQTSGTFVFFFFFFFHVVFFSSKRGLVKCVALWGLPSDRCPWGRSSNAVHNEPLIDQLKIIYNKKKNSYELIWTQIIIFVRSPCWNCWQFNHRDIT